MSAKPDLWMPLYFGAYLTDTMHLTTEQHGAYLLLLMACWKRGGELPNDDAQLAAIARLSLSQWRKARTVIEPFWQVTSKTWAQKRLRLELDLASGRAERARENGKKGGNPWVKEHYNEPGYLYAARAKSGLVKVGITVDPKRRLSEHRRDHGCGEPIALITVAQMGMAESAVLEHFAANANGEWLDLDASRESELLAVMQRFHDPASVPSTHRAHSAQHGPQSGRAPDPTRTPERGPGEGSVPLPRPLQRPFTGTGVPTPRPGEPLPAGPKTDTAKQDAYPPEFEALWSAYPERVGDNPKRRALHAWRARCKEGVAPADITAGVVRYAAFIRASGKEHTEFVKQAVTFLGPDKAFLQPWEVRQSGGNRGNADAFAEAERRLFGSQEKDVTE